MPFILDHFTGERRSELERTHQRFRQVIARLEEIYQVRPFNQQTAQSLTELYALVRAVAPTTILEIGAGSRSSTIALALAAQELPSPRPIISVDVNPNDFAQFAKTHFPEFRFAQVTDVCTEATKFRIPADCGDRVLMLYDAHDDDLPGIKIFPHARDLWFPAMPGAVIAVHDCSVFTRPQANLETFYHQAVYDADITLVGFGEVTGLVQYLQERRLDLGLPGREMETLQVGGEGTSLVYFQLPPCDKTMSTNRAEPVS